MTVHGKACLFVLIFVGFMHLFIKLSRNRTVKTVNDGQSYIYTIAKS